MPYNIFAKVSAEIPRIETNKGPLQADFATGRISCYEVRLCIGPTHAQHVCLKLPGPQVDCAKMNPDIVHHHGGWNTIRSSWPRRSNVTNCKHHNSTSRQNSTLSLVRSRKTASGQQSQQLRATRDDVASTSAMDAKSRILAISVQPSRSVFV